MDSKSLEEIVNKELEEVSPTSEQELEQLKNKLLGKDGIINSQLKNIKNFSPEEKKVFGRNANLLKDKITNFINNNLEKIKLASINKKIKNEKLDISIDGVNYSTAAYHIITKTIDEILEFFIQNGFKIIDGPEVESDYYCFEQVNIPKDHIARDMQDTFYFDESILLRTHTSSNQVREMEINKDKFKQLAIISPGKVYRRDTDDATHSHQFTQIEGMLIGEKINLGNLKSILDLFIKFFYGKDRKTRLRTSYFPFTEPSVEVDVSCGICNLNGCSACKNEGWIEILGAGMIHPEVLKNGGYDPEKVSGFAFGIGVERVAMLKYNIRDIRHLYNNDLELFNLFIGENI
ncbi:phenylalanine--tRNA ligase subunit alpha [Spiroplasma endosymbiont of Aspidapion aeneum]|uniref:phenylalanine--tRNA ligase subunit alpha n=1 Tax=Spiroplasma endosymbiont of Aspidapion aeneum TaxID=3066276 RepID=UPI00313CE1F6